MASAKLLAVVMAVFLFLWLASLHASSATGNATGIGAATLAAGHMLYTSEEGPPDGAAVPILSLHPVHGEEVRRWTQQHNPSSE